MIWVVLFSFPMAWSAAIAAADGAVKIALILARTGPANYSEASARYAAELAVDRINARGGLHGKQLELIRLDTQSTPIGAIKAAKTAVKSGVIAVIGANWSSQSLPMAKVMQSAGIPMITPSSTHPDVTRVGEFIFRVCFTDVFQARALAKFAYQDLNAATVVVLRNISESYSMELARQFTSTYEDLGGEVLWKGDYKTKAADFLSILKKINTIQPQAVFVPGYQRESGMLLRQAASLGIKARFFGGDGWGQEIQRIAGPAASGACFLNHWHPDFPSPESRELISAFRQRYPGADYHTVMMPLTYDAISLLADAVRRAGTLERSEIRRALANTDGYPGVTGRITFDANGDPIERTAAILKFTDQNVIFFKTIRVP